MNFGTLKGQGATEYLVILAVVLIIALVAIGIISQQASGSGAAEKNSRIYWKSEVFPVVVEDYSYSASTLTLVLNNRGPDAATIAISGISVSDGTTTVTGPAAQVILTPGAATTVAITAPVCTKTFSSYLNITYTKTGTPAKIVGQKPLVGTCAG